MVYKEIEIDSTWQQPLGEIRVIQEEADGRELRIYLYDNGSPLDLTGKTVSVYIQKPDNTMIYNSCEVEGNQATVTLTLQMMAVSGLTKLCELQIIDTDNHTLKVTLPPLRIIKSNYDGAIESTDEFSRLAEALNEANNATGIASEAADKANEAAQSANTAAQAANTAAQSANTAADAATSAAESANSQAQAAQTQAAYAKTQGDYAKTQGENAEEIYNQLKDIDVASLQADLDALEASKGQPNGLATLNSSGKLAQMPSASDVGAVPLADAGIKVTPLWKGKLTTNNTTVQLSQSILNFTMLLVTGTTNFTGLHWGIGNLLPVAKDSHADFGGDSYVSGGSDGSGLARIIISPDTALGFYFPNSTSLRSGGSGFAANAMITAVYGIK